MSLWRNINRGVRKKTKAISASGGLHDCSRPRHVNRFRFRRGSEKNGELANIQPYPKKKIERERGGWGDFRYEGTNLGDRGLM